jgi:hypothetical protein
MSVRVYPGDQVTLAMNFSGSEKRMQELAERLAQAFPQLVINLVDVYTMAPVVLWVQAPEIPPTEVASDSDTH